MLPAGTPDVSVNPWRLLASDSPSPNVLPLVQQPTSGRRNSSFVRPPPVEKLVSAFCSLVSYWLAFSEPNVKKARKPGPLCDDGAEGGTRTPTTLRPPAPQATNLTQPNATDRDGTQHPRFLASASPRQSSVFRTAMSGHGAYTAIEPRGWKHGGLNPYNQARLRWRSLPAPASARMRSPPRSAWAGWRRCIGSRLCLIGLPSRKFNEMW